MAKVYIHTDTESLVKLIWACKNKIQKFDLD